MRIDSRETTADGAGPIRRLLQSSVIQAGEEIVLDPSVSRGGRGKKLDSGPMEGRASRTC